MTIEISPMIRTTPAIMDDLATSESLGMAFGWGEAEGVGVGVWLVIAGIPDRTSQSLRI